MRTIERSDARGKSELGWLSSRFSYSFSEYLNPDRMNFGVLRVFNFDQIKPVTGFPMHHHEQMEIVTIMLEGVLTHQDSMGNQEELRADEVQVMTAGTGINHSEWNKDPSLSATLIQIWIYPKTRALLPQYEQHHFDPLMRKNRFQVLVSGIKKEDSLVIHQDALMARASLEAGHELAYTLTNRTHGMFLYVISGDLRLGSDMLAIGDSIEITEEQSLALATEKGADVLLIEVPLEMS
jgi:quercetin 2,3-dioxygenase